MVSLRGTPSGAACAQGARAGGRRATAFCQGRRVSREACGEEFAAPAAPMATDAVAAARTARVGLAASCRQSRPSQHARCSLRPAQALGARPARCTLARSRRALHVCAALREPEPQQEEGGSPEDRPSVAVLSSLERAYAQPSPADDPDGEYGVLRGEYDIERLKAFFGGRPLEVSSRMASMAMAAARVVMRWRSEEKLPLEQRTRGALLRNELSKLGPVFVKCGQTLAERPDLIGDEAAKELKLLQGENTPFENIEAWKMIAADLNWTGPLAPNVDFQQNGSKPLFKFLTPEPVAAASLAQVYRAETHDGKMLAIKVQRPQLLRQIAADMYVLRIGLDTLRRMWGSGTDLRPIADEVGTGVFRELDFHQEAANALEFERRLNFLGFVRAPKWDPEYTGPKGRARVLAMEWVVGKNLKELEPEAQLRMVNMAVQASVAQLIRTGFVHADPHAGNLMLDTEGRLVFLDFGLMCRVEPYIMEAFASGICHLLAGDWKALAYDFRDIGLAPTKAFEQRNPVTDIYEPCTDQAFADGIKRALLGEEDGLTRFGALATGLGGLSSEFKFLCPPFIILLCRTFLTLEGMADVVDPNFSIYTQALPYAVRRALSPSTEKGEAALRSALLTDQGEFRFGRLNELLEQVQTLAQTQTAEEEKAKAAAATRDGDGAAKPSASSGGNFDTVTGLLGSPEGAALRRVAVDADSLALVRQLTGREGRPLRRVSEQTLASALRNWHKHKEEAEQAAAAAALLTSGQRENMRREAMRRTQAMRVIAGTHLMRLLRSGLPGIIAMAALILVGARVGLVAAARVAAGAFVAWLGQFFFFRRQGAGAAEGAKGAPAGGAAAAGAA